MVFDLNFRVVDADHHYYELDDCFSRHIERAYQDRVIRPKYREDRTQTWWMGDEAREIFIAARTAPLVPGFLEGFLTGEKSVRTVPEDSDFVRKEDIPPLIERGPRLLQLDEQGIEACIMLSTVALALEHDFRRFPDALCANYRSYNRWLEEEWGFGRDGRIFGVPLISLLDVNWAVKEVERVANQGARLIFLKIGPANGRSPADPHFDPFWACVQDTRVHPIFHSSNGGLTDYYGTHWSENPDRGLSFYSAFQLYACYSDRGIGDTLAALVLHNLFSRFPGLKVLSIENGSSWVGPLLHGMDKAVKQVRNGPWLGGRLTDKPSDIFREHVYVTPYHEDDVPSLVEMVGASRILFGSDYPHPEGLERPKDFEKGLLDLPDEDVRMIMRDNSAQLLGIG